jgi:hypothetical protein
MFARLAVRYVDTLDDPDRVKILADEFHYEAGSIPKLIARARNEYHFLTPTPKGRSGGSVTPKAYALLTSRAMEQRRSMLSKTERSREKARGAANKARADVALARYQRGEIKHSEWELATFGQNFPRDALGNVVLNFDEGS